MKIDMSFHKFFICSSLAFSLTSPVFAKIVPIPSKNFNGQEGRVFPYTTLSYPEGTTAIFSGDLIISNIDNAISETSSSCFSNKAGYFTILGQGYTLSFNQIRSASNGAAISDSVTDLTLPLTLLNFKNILFINSHTLTSTEAGTGTGGTNNTVKANSAMLYSTVPVIFKDNQTILFQQDRSAGPGAGINAASLTITGTTTSCSFDSNASSSFGGALASVGPVKLVNNTAPQTFLSNGAAYYGGAIYLGTYPPAGGTGTPSTGSLTASANSGNITFQNNSALTGGAIYSLGNLTFSNNSNILFANNTASPASNITLSSTSTQPQTNITVTGGFGGAIYCIAPQAPTGGGAGSGTTTDPTLTCTGQTSLSFQGNCAASEGGAIYAKKIVLSDNGSTQFIGNVSAKGGAISVAASGTLELTANAGNIVFDHNLTVNTTTNTGTTTSSTHNSIHFNEGATFSTLAASAGNSIFFYDPITTAISQTAPQPPAQPAALTINPSSGNYQGNIVFSGEKLPPDEAAEENNVTSTINQQVTLENGSLILKKGAVLKVYSFTQSSGSTVVMDLGTTLSTTNQQNTNGGITLSNLAINLASLGENNSAVVEIASTSGQLSVTGPITFVDSSGTFYENHELLNENTVEYTIATFTGNTNPPPNINITDITTATGATSSPYGYQGTWKLETSPGTQADTQTLTATWTKTSFIPGPERLAPLVPNSLWGNIVDLRAVNQVMETCSQGLPYKKGLCLTGVSNFFHCNHTQAARSYRHISGGYVLHANTQTLADSVFGFGFGQLFAKSKDYLVANDKSKVYVITAYTGFTKPFFNISNLFASMATRASYCRSNERLTTNYTSLGTAQAGWSNNGWLGELEANFPVVLSSRILNLKKLIPFVKAEVAYANQGRFKEKNTEGRAFGHGHLMNVSIPAGIKFDKTSHHAPDFYSISLSCISDVYRYNPHCSTVLIANGATWTTVATNPSRWGVKVQASSHNKVNNNIEIYGHGGCEIRRSSRQYTVDLGSKFRF